MSDPIQKDSIKRVSPHPLVEKREDPPECGKGKEPDARVDKKGNLRWVCIPEGTLGELMGDSMTCGEGGGPPCFGIGSLKMIPLPRPAETVSPHPTPAPKDQFKPAPPESLKNVIEGTVEYTCKTRTPNAESRIVSRDITVPLISNESKESTRARLERAARDMEKTIAGCQNAKFLQIISPLQEPLTVSDPNTSPSKNLWNEFDRICGPGGKWENRLICWWP